MRPWLARPRFDVSSAVAVKVELRGDGLWDLYLIRTVQNTDRRDCLLVTRSAPAGCRSTNGVPLICDAPQLLVVNGASFRTAESEGW